MAKSIWGDLPPFTIKALPARKEAAAPTSMQAQQVLSEIGQNALALNALEMEKQRLKPLFKGFNPAHISPKALGEAGMLLFKLGFIDNLTADLMSRTGAEFDAQGKVLNVEQPINALEFLANRIAQMKERTQWGDRYAETLLPDYVRTIHVMQNLQAFAESGDSYEMLKIKAQERNGKRAPTPTPKLP
ncbi:hypothetical protein RRX38_20875 [Pseudomonas sp. DTU_2021_1001937_2_SI_NGA_ILE_001]|uniref:hypothetical protein n=1 Tax=Pseudomonas sp. DTU_2021_1001937_2_SI_NGA_ILE_001 TaxID=3077589 RepID=UPI0025F50EF8|nr:hypothetical protein [Pseudomonas sp. DTU_2021_1001937_2_SI_NGA_ILE_001]WNW13507.1 hypothetical protein RRX38_20875 [Pseudomonas sp. DTU_2021_1001937_2_SI_NGA_ILE_001]